MDFGMINHGDRDPGKSRRRKVRAFTPPMIEVRSRCARARRPLDPA
jgi:hypothetical protein